MGKYSTPFIKALKRDWETRFPFVTHAKEAMLPFRPKTTTFAIDKEYCDENEWLYLYLDFNPKRPGAFTVEIIISHTEQPQTLRHCFLGDLQNRKEGIYRIGLLVNNQDMWWDLKDIDGELLTFIEEMMPFSEEEKERWHHTNNWKPQKYTNDLSIIIDEAINDLGDKLSSYVFPKILLKERARK